MNENCENGQGGSNLKRKWRKKPKSFLSNAKKYGKKGQMGRGTKIPDDLYQYFVGILDVLKAGIQDEDERDTLVANVLERTAGDEVNIISNQLGSRVIELLLPYSSAEDLERFTEAVDPHLRRMVTDNFTSHIIETLLRVSSNRATEHMQGDTDEEVPKKKAKLDRKYSDAHIKKCYDFTIKICKYALNNLEDFVWDSYANHILRSALKCLSGITLLPGEKPKMNYMLVKSVDKNKGIPPHTTQMEYREVPQEFKEMVRDFATRLMTWPQFKELPYKSITSALLQVLLFACKNVDKHVTRELIKKLLDEAFIPEDWVSSTVLDETEKMDMEAGQAEGNQDPGGSGVAGNTQTHDLPPVFQSTYAVRLLEAALFVAKKKTYSEIYSRCFKSRLARLATVPMLNFTVQRLLDNCICKNELECMFAELSGALAGALAAGNSGVLVALARGCLRLRLRARQAHYATELEAVLQCSEPDRQKYLSVACLRLTRFDKLDVAALTKEYFIHVHGSVILQCILGFQRPAKAVNSLLELQGEELLVIFCDAKGCHIADAICSGQNVGVKARDKLIWKMKGFYQRMALSQYGSRAFEKILEAAAPEQKLKIMAELADKSNLLNGTQYGKLIAAKLDLATFKESQTKWEAAQKKGVKNEE